MRIFRAVSHTLLRMIYGTAVLLCVSEFLKMQGVSTIAAVNPINIVTVGILGFGAFAVLYGIIFLANL